MGRKKVIFAFPKGGKASFSELLRGELGDW